MKGGRGGAGGGKEREVGERMLQVFIAGFDAATAPGRTEHGSPTLCNVCTRRHDDRTP